MAFEQLNHYTERLKSEWVRLKERPLANAANIKTDQDRRDHNIIYGRLSQIESDLCSYYLEVLKVTGKWKHQAAYCLMVIQAMNPALAEGMTAKRKRKSHATTDAGAE